MEKQIERGDKEFLKLCEKVGSNKPGRLFAPPCGYIRMARSGLEWPVKTEMR